MLNPGSRPAIQSSPFYQELRSRINQGSLELYEQPDLLAELRRLRTRYAAGQAAVVNPRVGGSHGDLAQALALAVWEHRESGDASLDAHYGWDTRDPALALVDWNDPNRGVM